VVRVAVERERRVGRKRRAPSARRPWMPWLLGGLLVLAALAAAGWFLLRPTTREQEGGAIATLQTLDQHALLFSPTDPNVVFFGHHNGVLRSEDGGRTWKPLVDRRGFDAMQLATAGTSNPRRLYLAGHDVFQASDDGGATWRPVEHNLPGTDIHQFALNPDNPDRLTAVVVGAGAFRSMDGGRTWAKLPAQPPGDVTALASAGADPETLYVGTAGSGVLRSVDEGRSWGAASGRAAADAAFRTVLALAVDPANRRALYAGTDSGLAKSVDAGATWTALPYPGDNALAVAVSPMNPNVVLAVASSPRRQGLVYRSDDGGLSWGGRP
jgi:photosystem II stability/assembly factor-like uncharacterized protein